MEKIVKAEAVDNFCVAIETVSGFTGVFDVKPYMHAPVFQALQDETYFRQVRPDGCAISWPGEQDFCSDTLIQDIQQSMSH